ncbi:SDR family NAD(P)-dependent oxidoreductase [Vibrio aestuarianus]|uniref:SDR family NAD(P)-dependent oxidoreductase n=1 Tax=Vibrio aestuarianus TaxID=28171 RepID=UPI00237C67FA|nr:SDR family oxidoreductase [Vibrio aestuarianus]MDE1330416.1 SDR family oxidoreductase [Vibrio aestuarianus]
MPEPKTVVISGGSKGLGLAVVKELLCLGYKVATFSRSKSEEINSIINHNNFYWESVDIDNLKDIKRFTTNVIKKFGRIDILINNAAYLFEGLLAFSSSDKIGKSISINIMGTINLTQSCVKNMMRNKSGTILNISSINSVRGHKGVSVYTASKAAIDGMMKSLARELGPLNIRVNSISPGFFESNLVEYLSEERKKQIIKRTPLGRTSKVSEIVNVILFLVSDKASFISGQNISVDGGMTC